MSYQQTNITVSLVSHLIITSYYLAKVLPMYRQGEIVDSALFKLWAVVIIAAIIVTVIGTILTNILLSIVHAIKTQSDKPARFIEDERDKLIGLKGTRASYITFSIGVLIAMLSFVFGQPALVLFSLLIFASLIGEIVGDVFQLYFYGRGS
jgi:hypothetical protein